MNNRQKFLNLLFEPHESTCFSPDIYGTAIEFIDGSKPTDLFFSINPLLGSRKDVNVACFRNVLLEIDDMDLPSQLAYVIGKLGRENISSIVYSGGKSYHFIISLLEPLNSREEYDVLVQRLYALLPKIDPACKNPSRLSRLPDALRLDKGTEQTLVYLGTRIPTAKLENMLPALPQQKTYTKIQTGFFHPLVVEARFAPDKVMQKLKIQSRNMFFFWLGNRLSESGCSKEQKADIVSDIYIALKDKSDFSLKEAKTAARI